MKAKPRKYFNIRNSLTGFLASSLFSTLLSSAISKASPTQVNPDPTSQSDSSTKKKNHSKEWKLLPKQRWEIFNISAGKEVVLAALDKDTKSNLNNKEGFEPQAIPASEQLPTLGQIIGSRTESQYVFTDDVVYIRSKGLLQVGDTYAITDVPDILKSSKSDRTGYSYLILGKVKILAVRDDLFLGKMTSVKSFIPRGSLLIANPPKVLELLPIAGPSPVQATLLFDHRFSTFSSAQYKEVFIDRGSADGLKPGMILRVYQHYDPSNEKKITSSELMVDAEIQVTQVTESFSTALVLTSFTTITENSSAILMTDISELIKPERHGIKGKGLDAPKMVKTQDPLEELDRLDDIKNLGAKEKKKLNQLEKWQANPDVTPTEKKSAEMIPPLNSTPEAPPANAASTSTGTPTSTPVTPPVDAPVSSTGDNTINNLTPPDSSNSSSTLTPSGPTTSLEIPADVPPPAMLDESPPAPPMIPVSSGSAPSPESANATYSSGNSSGSSSSEPALPAPPPPEL